MPEYSRGLGERYSYHHDNGRPIHIHCRFCALKGYKPASPDPTEPFNARRDSNSSKILLSQWGFKNVAVGPLLRSSYTAGELFLEKVIRHPRM